MSPTRTLSIVNSLFAGLYESAAQTGEEKTNKINAITLTSLKHLKFTIQLPEMIKKIKLPVFILIGIITVFVMVATAFWGRQPGQGVVSSPRAIGPNQAVGQEQRLARDPFKDAWSRQQKSGAAQALPAHNTQPVQIVHGNVTATVKPGADPFKAFLELQSKTKSEDAAISPFGK